jgi:3-methyladenine DNA glycosylase/8-oxoguanine DNA glycosylase
LGLRVPGQPFDPPSNATHLFRTPEVLVDANLIGVGLPAERANAIRAFAGAVCDGLIAFERAADFRAFLARFCEIPGIGDWVTQYVSMRALGEPDAFPSGDLDLVRALR